MNQTTSPTAPHPRPRVPKPCPCDCGTMTPHMVCAAAFATLDPSVKDQLAHPDREQRLAASRAVFAHAAEIKRQRAELHTSVSNN